MSLTLSTILAVSDHAAGANAGDVGKAAAEAEKSKTPFYIAGMVLVAFAIVISVVGFQKPDFPGNSGAARGVMALSVTLVAAAMITIVYVNT
jgi:hypothetical protein